MLQRPELEMVVVVVGRRIGSPEDGLGHRIMDNMSPTVVTWFSSFVPMPAHLVLTPTYLPWIQLEPQGWNRNRSQDSRCLCSHSLTRS